MRSRRILPAAKTNSITIVFFLPKRSMIRRVKITPGKRNYEELEKVSNEHRAAMQPQVALIFRSSIKHWIYRGEKDSPDF